MKPTKWRLCGSVCRLFCLRQTREKDGFCVFSLFSNRDVGMFVEQRREKREVGVKDVFSSVQGVTGSELSIAVLELETISIRVELKSQL